MRAPSIFGQHWHPDNYPQGTTISFLSLPNVHAVASAHSALLRSVATVAALRSWCHAPEAAAWMQLSSGLLEAAGGTESVVSKMMADDDCVLVVGARLGFVAWRGPAHIAA